MAKINDNFLKLQAGYLFPEIARRVREFGESNPKADIIKLGIGDVVLPLSESVLKGFHKGVDEMGVEASFKGYGPEQGYQFLREKIRENDYAGLPIEVDEIFVSDGSKCDSGNIQEIFAANSRVAISDPAYPVYVDSNVMAGRTGAVNDKGMFEGICYMPMTEANKFTPAFPSEPADLIYLCSPNNPTGVALTKTQAKEWVDYAKKSKAIILFDAAYERFISSEDAIHSIYEIDGARDCAIEFRSFSKTAGFTGVRCGFVTIPKTLMGESASGEAVSIHSLWNRRHSTKFNGASYPVQCAAASAYTKEGKAEIDALVTYYMENAALIKSSLEGQGYTVYGATDAPYAWIKDPEGDSWAFFDKLLEKCQIVSTPGAGFGPSGEGFVRLSAFAKRDKVEEAMKRISSLS